MKKSIFLLFVLFLQVICAKDDLQKNKYFNNFKQNQMPKIINFGKNNFFNISGVIFYPFGGPDVTYPMLLFTNFDEIILAGLEPVEEFKIFPVELNNKELSSLSSLYKRSFFITDQMLNDVTNVMKLIFKQLENLGVNKIDIDNSSQYFSSFQQKTIKIVNNQKITKDFFQNNSYKKISITFFYNGKNRKITYIQTDFSNDKINLELLEQVKPEVTLFKAASHLPQNKNFTKFRDYILKNSNIIVQDSTGIAFNKIKDTFILKLKGKYLEPYKFETADKQKDYRNYSEKLNNEPLNFCFGYGCLFVPTNILIAIKKPQNYADEIINSTQKRQMQ